MKKISIILTFLTFPFLTINALAGWEPDRKLSTSESSAWTNENMGQCMAVSGDTIHVVWCDTIQGSGIYYKHSTDRGIIWGADTRLTNSPDIADFQSIAVSGSTVHVAYRDGQKISYYKRSLDGGSTWQEAVPLGNYYWWPSIASAGNYVYVALNSNETGNSEVWFRRSTDNGTTCDSVVRISNALLRSEDPTISAWDKYVYLAWNDNRTGKMEIFHRRSSDYGVTWGDETKMSNSASEGGFTYAPMISASPSNVDLVWSGGTGIMHKNSSDNGETWGVYDSLVLNSKTLYASIKRNGKNVHLVCFGTTNGLFYQYSPNGGTTWDKDTCLVSPSSKPTGPFVGITGSVVHVIWSDLRDGHKAIYYKRNPTGNILPTEVNSDNSNGQNPICNFSIFQNPANQNTEIEFELAKDGNVTISLFDLQGHEISTLLKEFIYAGALKRISLATSNLEPGLYLCRISADGFEVTKKLILGR